MSLTYTQFKFSETLVYTRCISVPYIFLYALFRYVCFLINLYQLHTCNIIYIVSKKYLWQFLICQATNLHEILYTLHTYIISLHCIIGIKLSKCLFKSVLSLCGIETAIVSGREHFIFNIISSFILFPKIPLALYKLFISVENITFLRSIDLKL